MSPGTAVTLAASDTGKGSPIGLFVILLLLVAVYLLYRSMSGRLRRLPERFPGYGTAGSDAAGADPLTTAAVTGVDVADADDTRPGGADADDTGAEDPRPKPPAER